MARPKGVKNKKEELKAEVEGYTEVLQQSAKEAIAEVFKQVEVKACCGNCGWSVKEMYLMCRYYPKHEMVESENICSKYIKQ